MELNKKYYMKTESGYYIGFFLFLLVTVVNVISIITPGTRIVNLVIAILLTGVFGALSVILLYLIIQTKRHVSYFELSETTITFNTLRNKKIEQIIKTKIEYKNRKNKLEQILIFSKEGKAVISLNDCYSVPLTDIKKTIEKYKSVKNKK